MRRRALTLVLVAASLLLPARLAADKPQYQTFYGVLGFVSGCSETSWVLETWCTRQPTMYVMKVKGAQKYEGQRVLIQGTPVTTSCGLPGVEVKWVAVDDSPPPDCP
ncbi:MAG TPA: hypothetical protein VFQ07_07675 [Candidatus Polarisedimenticolia bacterium]|nr:hypothetical protein [Candidatus Polarisedimenticolia bacterium]